MSGISSNVGIFSGIDTASLIDQLIAIESRPKAAAQIRLTELKSQQAAILDINSRLLSLSTAAQALRVDNTFKTATASSSASGVLTATAGNNATLGSFNFIVNRLVSTDQKISKGFADKDTAGVGATSFSFEVGGGRVDSSTSLGVLNGGLGVERGKISITDSTGAVAEVDLSTATTVQDVIDTINATSGVAVTASASGYGLSISGVQKIDNVFGSQTASSLGIAKTATANVITGDQVLNLSTSTPLSLLRDGAGVAFLEKAGLTGSTVADFIINDGVTANDIVLGEITQTAPDPTDPPVVLRNAAATIGDLFTIINADTAGTVTGAISADGTKIELTSSVGNITVTNGPSNRPTAADLGLLGQTPAGTISSTRLLSGINSTLVSNLNGGSGLTATDLSITTADSSVFNITLNADGSTADIIDAINTGTAGAVTATLNTAGNGIQLTDTTTGGTTFQIAGGAATDLNLAGSFASGVADSSNLQSKYVSQATLLADLNAGAGIGVGSFTITDSLGVLSTISVDANDKSVFDLLSKINGAGVGVTASINSTGDGILIQDTASGVLGLTIADDSGRVAKSLNLVGTGDPLTTNQIDGSYEKTLTFQATDTLQSIADQINAAGVGVDASIVNDGFGASPFRLIFTSETSGSIGQATIDTNGFGLGLQQLSKAQDAVVFFGSTDPAKGIALTSSTNTISNVVAGVSLNLKSTSTAPVEINISRDIDTIETGITDFVDAFNGVIDRLAFHGRFNLDTNEKGSLLGDGVLQQIESGLDGIVLGNGVNVQSDFKFLFEAGVAIGEGGKLEFDAEKFRAALDQDPAGVADLFSGFAQDPLTSTVIAPGVTVPNTTPTFSKLGVLERLAKLANTYTDSIDGLLSTRKTTFDSQIKLQEDRIAAFDVQLNNKRGVLERQFAAMEQALAQLQSQQSALGSLG